MEGGESVNKGTLALHVSSGERVTIGDVTVWVSLSKKNRITLIVQADKSIPIIRETAKDKDPRPR